MTRKEALEYINNMYMYEDTKNALETLIPEFGKTGSDNVIYHEDKYKEALLEARAVLEPCLKYSNGKVREALDSIDKELKCFESEGERIRKRIRLCLDECVHSDIIRDYERDECLDYLGKQKENIEKEYVFRPLAGTDITVAAEQAIRRAKNGDKLVLAFNGVYFPISKYDSVGALVDKYDYQIKEKQKEQKPTLVEKLRSISTPADENWFEIQKRWEKEDEQKPDWSEEDEMMRENIISDLRYFRDCATDEEAVSDYEEEIAWLKSLRNRPKSSDTWKPSEEQRTR